MNKTVNMRQTQTLNSDFDDISNGLPQITSNATMSDQYSLEPQHMEPKLF